MISNDDYILVVCPTCRTRLHPHVSEAGTKITCPDCLVKVQVPSAPRRRKTPSAPKVVEGHYDVGAAAENPPIEFVYTSAQAKVYQADRKHIPKWTFFSGVFQFPWVGDAFSRWVYMAIGCTVWIGMIALIKVLSDQLGSGQGARLVTALFFGMTMIWMTVLAGSYSASCFMSVIQETAGGAAEVTQWPEPNWRDWLWNLIFFGYLMSFALVVGSGVGKLAELAGGSFVVGLIIGTHVTLPFILLSALESVSLWQPFSTVILNSCFRFAWAWGLVLVELSVIAGIPAFIVWSGFDSHPILVAFVVGPLAAAAILVYARLIGRLAWRISR